MPPLPSQPVTADPTARSAGRTLVGLAPFVGLALVLFLVGVTVVLLGRGASVLSLRVFATTWAQVGLFACAAALPLSVRSVDFSLTGTAAVCGLAFGVVGGVPGLVFGMVLALVAGVVNGALAGLLKLHPAITTFATGVGMVGLVFTAASPQGRPVENPLPPAFGFAILALVILGAVAVDAITLTNVRLEVPDVVRRAAMHVAAALLVGLAGVVQVSTLRFASPSLASNHLMLLAFAAAVIGGTSAFGGWRSLVGAVLAAGFLAAVSHGLVALGAGSYLIWIVATCVLLVGLGGDRLRAHLTGSRSPAGQVQTR